MTWIPKEIEDLEGENKDIYNAFVYLYKYIDGVSEKIDALYDLVPVKYKKFNPRSGENPFFGIKDMKPQDPKEYEEAKKRMANLLKRSNEN